MIKVLLSSRPKLLSEVIRNLIGRQPDMQVVGEILDPLQLMNVAKLFSVDVVVITPLKANGEPLICRRLLVEHRSLIIVTQSAEGNSTYLYRSGATKLRIEESSSEALFGAIRTAVSAIAS